MNQKTNLPLIDPTSGFDAQVQEYFANYFKQQPSISDAEYSRAKSFFLERTNGNVEAAAALTAAVIEAAITIDTYVNDVLDKFEGEKDLKKIQQRIEQYIEKQDYFGAAELKAKEDEIKDKMRMIRSTKALPMHLRPTVEKNDIGQVLADKT